LGGRPFLYRAFFGVAPRSVPESDSVPLIDLIAAMNKKEAALIGGLNSLDEAWIESREAAT
jgi:hypothetical protein